MIAKEADPWERVYKIASGRMKKETLLVSLEKQDEPFTQTIRETLKVMIEGLLPNDNEEEETEAQQEIRRQVSLESTGQNEEDLKEEELIRAVKQMKDKRSTRI